MANRADYVRPFVGRTLHSGDCIVTGSAPNRGGQCNFAIVNNPACRRLSPSPVLTLGGTLRRSAMTAART
eukprot:1134958-Prorocentrum_minimum.AAC.1